LRAPNGTCNTFIVTYLFYQQSKPWKPLVERCCARIMEATKACLVLVSTHTIDATTRVKYQMSIWSGRPYTERVHAWSTFAQASIKQPYVTLPLSSQKPYKASKPLCESTHLNTLMVHCSLTTAEKTARSVLNLA